MERVLSLIGITLKIIVTVFVTTFIVVMFSDGDTDTVTTVMGRSMVAAVILFPIYLALRFGNAIFRVFKKKS